MAENFLLPFQLESSLIRGRIVRLDSVLDDILSRHDYPAPVLQLTGETLILCALLSSMLKYEGIFTLQAQGDGPVRMAVADMTSEGGIRACAAFKKEELTKASENAIPATLLGSGYMAFTVDQGEHTERYQGIVELKPGTLVESVQHYFTQSEQIATGIVLSLKKKENGWRGGAIMVQKMPEETAEYNKAGEANEDDWRRTMVLLSTLQEEEMLDPTFTGTDILYRLFHEEGVRVFEEQPLTRVCRCNAERVKNIVKTMSADDVRDITVDGCITMTCEFCSTDYSFDPEDIGKGDNA
jgi:molecular chaperone Hsp33